MSDEFTWDVGLRRPNPDAHTLLLTIPSVIARSLTERGYNRATIKLTSEGILCIPYVDANPERRLTTDTVELPF